MKRLKFSLLALLLAAMLPVFVGCGCNSESSEADGRGDVVSEEPAVNAEDFYGCWEYTDFDLWLYIYGDGTYEWFEADGTSTVGSYVMEDDALVLEDSDLSLTLGEEGFLVDSDGDQLFVSELSDFTPPYFEDNELAVNYQLGQGEVVHPNTGYYYAADTDGEGYGVCQTTCAVNLVSTEDLGNGYVRKTITVSNGMKSEDIAYSGRVTVGYQSQFYDWYTGVLLPQNDNFGVEDDWTYVFPVGEDEVEVMVEHSGEWLDKDGYFVWGVETYVVTMPDWYDGLVLTIPALPADWSSYQMIGWAKDDLNSYVEALEAPYYMKDGIICRVG